MLSGGSQHADTHTQSIVPLLSLQYKLLYGSVFSVHWSRGTLKWVGGSRDGHSFQGGARFVFRKRQS